MCPCHTEGTAIFFTGSGSDTDHFSAWTHWPNFEELCFCLFCSAAFQFYVFETPSGCLFPQHTDSSQPVSYNKQHPLCWFLSPFLIIFLVILKRPFQSHGLGHAEMQIQTGREFQAIEQKNLLAGQWVLRMEALGCSTYIRLPGTEQSVIGKVPEGSLLSLWTSRSSGPGHLKGPSFRLSFASICAFICISKLQRVNNNALKWGLGQVLPGHPQ